MAKASSQKFIARNRAPRVQIEYDVELYGSEKKVELPFVIGVLSDLTGKSSTEQPPLAERKMLEFDIDNFDARLRSLQPRVAFNVDNTLTGQGKLPIDITFESMRDFLPSEVARKVPGLAKLLEARMQLSNLLTYMDGKAGAEDMVAKLLSDPEILKGLSQKGRFLPAKAVEERDTAQSSEVAE
ncbi:type VI secretion system contractile sheath small subunit [Ensifer adhaerens]|uniref:type VI secretion system contractile sheath small subunit n=1 Tax=Ensifer adhaerens TaxID=106592 RepID=UPI003850247E